MSGAAGKKGTRPVPHGASTSRAAAEAKAAKEKAVRRIIEVLHTWGIHTIGQFAALDPQELNARLGPEAVAMWKRATGRSERLLKLVRPPEVFLESFEFEHEIETAEPLLFMLRRFLEQFALRLDALYLVARQLTLQIRFADRQEYEHRFEIPEPTNSIEVLFRMLQTHLEQFTSSAPIIAVALEVQPARPGQQQFSLFEAALRDPARLSETLTRLTGLLGPECVGTPVLEETYRPDAFRMEPFRWELPETMPPTESPPRVALRRFRPAHAASVLLAKTAPAHLRSDEISGRVAETDGPYLASGEWWDRDAWAHAEWDLELENGAVCRCHAHADGWAVAGIYD